jgi:hypothetical protein
MIHGFLRMGGVIDRGQSVLDEVGDALRRALSPD